MNQNNVTYGTCQAVILKELTNNGHTPEVAMNLWREAVKNRSTQIEGVEQEIIYHARNSS